MITLYSGTPGSGKSLHLAEVLYYRVKNYNGVVIGNFDLNVGNIKGRHKGKYISINNDRLTPDRLIKFSHTYRVHYMKDKPMPEGKFLLVIDECQILFNSREWQMSGRNAWLSFFTQHRKLGFDIILISQFDRMIDRQIRSLIEYELIHRKVNNYGFAGKVLGILCGGSLFVCVKMWYPMKERLSAEFFIGHKKYFRMYDTFAVSERKAMKKARLLLTVGYGISDLIDYIVQKGWNNCPTGQLIAYTALFGKGNTLSVVHYIVGMYKRYNNKPVYDRDRKKFVTQKIHVISNVDLNIPYERFVSLEQIVRVAEKFREIDMENDTLTCTLVLGDEFSVQMNIREFKKNKDPLFLNTLLTCRHHNISLIYDAQRFNHVDALLRQVTSYVVECRKVWRFMVQIQYDAYELENATNPTLITPKLRFGWFIRNRDYNAYDTLACVGNLKKSVESGDMMSEDEILALQCNNGANMDAVSKPSRRYRKNKKKTG